MTRIFAYLGLISGLYLAGAIHVADHAASLDVRVAKLTLEVRGVSLGPIGLDKPPFPAARLTVLMVEDKLARASLPREQMEIVDGPEVIGWLRANADYRIWDKGIDLSKSDEAQVWRDALMAVPSGTKQWLLISNGQSGYSGPWPKDKTAMLDLLQKFGGK